MINEDRLAQEFLHLVHIESPSRREGEIATYLAQVFRDLGAQCVFDNSARKTGSEVGNLVVKVPGTVPGSKIFFAAHMDTVEPCARPRISLQNGVFRSDGRTICGADDKSAIAALLEMVRVLKEKGLGHPPLELIFTTCEEIGLLGAKNLDYSLIEAEYGYALDSEDPDELINQAPEAIRFRLQILGKAAHAGLNPEKGINAIKVAGQGLAQAPLGRIDPETTANIGVIRGGTATNIVPEEVELFGEVRSHRHEKLETTWEGIKQAFAKAVALYKTPEGDRPELRYERKQDYPLMRVSVDHPVIKLAQRAAQSLGRNLKITSTGGGSDANIFNGQGLACVILGTGMQQVHSTEEYITLEDLIKTARLSLQIVLEAAVKAP